MKPNFRTCPQCSTRNRLEKEYCVKCGESLEGVAAGDPAEEAAKKSKPGFFVSEEGAEARSPLFALVLFLGALGAAYGAFQVLRSTEATPPATAAPVPRAQASLPPPVAVPKGPGAEDYTAGMTALRAGDFATATRLLRQAVAAAGTQAEFHLALAEALEGSGLQAEALAEFEAAANLPPTNVRYVAERAKALGRAGRDADAIAVYESAVLLDDTNVGNLKELASLHMKGGDFARARPHLERVVALEPDDLAPKQSLARALEAARDLDGAAKQYRDILTALPTADLPRTLLADILYRQSKPDEALALLDEGLRLDAGAVNLVREKGRVFDRQKRYAEAVAAYSDYVQRAPGASDAATFKTRIEQLKALMAQ